MHFFTVLYKFDAQDPSELSVMKGDIVRTERFVDENGWVKIELASNPRKRGFVPAGYLRETKPPGGDADTPTSSRSVSPAQNASYTNAALAHGAVMRDNLRASQADEATRPQFTGVVPSSTVNPTAVVEGFMKNEVFYKQLMKQREDSMSKIEAALNEATGELAVCREKNGQLVRKLRDLDVLMGKERTKWKDRVEEERMLLAQKAAANYSSGTAPTVSSNAMTGTIGHGTTRFD
jgi:hypothetical protein